MDKIKQTVSLECKECGRVIDKFESMKTGGYCWKHKPQDMKPDPKLKRRKVIEKIHEQQTPQLTKPLYPGQEYKKGVYAWTKEGVMELMEDLNNSMTVAEITDKHRRGRSGVYGAIAKFFRKDDEGRYILKKNLKLFEDVERDKAFQRAFGAKVEEKMNEHVLGKKTWHPPEGAVGWVDTDKPGVQKLTYPTPEEILDTRIKQLREQRDEYRECIKQLDISLYELEQVKEAFEERRHVR